MVATTFKNLSVGMEIEIGSRFAKQESYTSIVGKKGIITHLGEHPDGPDISERASKDRMVYISMGSDSRDQGCFHDPETDTWSWYILVEDVILKDNEGYLKALPEW